MTRRHFFFFLRPPAEAPFCVSIENELGVFEGIFRSSYRQAKKGIQLGFCWKKELALYSRWEATFLLTRITQK